MLVNGRLFTLKIFKFLFLFERRWFVFVRRCPDKPPGAIYCTLGLLRASLVGLPRLALSKPRLLQMAPGG